MYSIENYVVVFFFFPSSLQVYPKDTPLALFTSLLPEDLVNLSDQSGLRQRILNAVEMARQWINQSEVKKKETIASIVHTPLLIYQVTHAGFRPQVDVGIPSTSATPHVLFCLSDSKSI